MTMSLSMRCVNRELQAKCITVAARLHAARQWFTARHDVCSNCRSDAARHPNRRRRSVRAKANPRHLPVVFGFGCRGDLLTVRGEDASTAAAAHVALVLARTHFGMACAERMDLRA